MLRDLLANLAVVALILLVHTALTGRYAAGRSKLERISFAFAMAASAIASMALTVEVAQNIFFDLRNPIVVIAALYGGAPAALLTGFSEIFFRLQLSGGTSAAAAIVTIFACIIGGLALRASPLRQRKPLQLAAAAILAASLIFGVMHFESSLVAQLSNRQILFFTAMSFVTTLALGALVLAERERNVLARTNRQFRAMVDALPDCLNIKDAEGRFLGANPATAALMGAPSPKAMIGKTDYDFYPKEKAENFRGDELAAIGLRKPLLLFQEKPQPEGGSRWLSTLKTPIFDENGQLNCIVTSNRDVTDVRLAELKLAETRTYLEQTLAHMSDAMVMYDAGGTLLFCNEQYRNLFPRTGKFRVPGMNFRNIITASLKTQEETVTPGSTPAEHVETRFTALFQDGAYRIQMADGRTYNCRTRVMDNGHVLRTISDITEQAEQERRLDRRAHLDALTGLNNRAGFEREFARRFERSKSGEESLGLVLIDLDRFKQVNDTHGHPVGDMLLAEMAARLKSVCAGSDFIARLGGDEFAILTQDIDVSSGTANLLDRLLRSLTRSFSARGIPLQPGATIGFASRHADTPDQAALVSAADAALYAAKRAGRGTWRMAGQLTEEGSAAA